MASRPILRGGRSVERALWVCFTSEVVLLISTWFLAKVNSFGDLENIVYDAKRIVPILARHFQTVDDVDLFILALAEKPLRGSLVGPTLGCLLAMQFQRVKQGDRFWYLKRTWFQDTRTWRNRRFQVREPYRAMGVHRGTAGGNPQIHPLSAHMRQHWPKRPPA
jgi:hypothetical protein